MLWEQNNNILREQCGMLWEQIFFSRMALISHRMYLCQVQKSELCLDSFKMLEKN